jgi:geranylgeranyl diphosphate synthase type II
MIPRNSIEGARTGGQAVEDARSIRDRVDACLERMIEGSEAMPANLAAAMRHALLAPSKRLRPVLLYMIADPDPDLEGAALTLGCAVEMVHTASLVLDDLPCMDDARMRRERPCSHVAFGQATAILSAIALLSRAFGVISELEIPAAARTRLAAILSDAVGQNGLVAGQEIDINGRASLVGEHEIENLNWLKTGTLFVASAEMGAVLADMPEDRIDHVRRFARHLGLAFQTADDLLDKSADPKLIGKDVNKDEGKATLVSIFGARQARLTCEEHLAAADAALISSGVNSAPIQALIAKYFKSKLASDAG